MIYGTTGTRGIAIISQVVYEKEENKMKTIAWNVDTQYDFMRADGKLYGKGAETLEPTLEKLTNYFRNKGITIVNTADQHFSDSAELSSSPDYKDTFPEHCMRGTRGADYIPAVLPHDPYVIDWTDEQFDLEKLTNSKEIVIYKDRLDVFSGSPHSDNIVKALAPERVIVYGVFTEFCLNYAVTGLLERGLEVYVVEDAIKEIAESEPVLQKWKELGKDRLKFIRAEDLYSR
jgi:nicotinamidase/pyrazinamidase